MLWIMISRLFVLVDWFQEIHHFVNTGVLYVHVYDYYQNISLGHIRYQKVKI
jgi:hypothetical protein